jgi:hypothetical protein
MRRYFTYSAIHHGGSILETQRTDTHTHSYRMAAGRFIGGDCTVNRGDLFNVCDNLLKHHNDLLKLYGDILDNYGSLLPIHGSLLQMNCNLMKVSDKVLKLLDIFWNFMTIEDWKVFIYEKFHGLWSKILQTLCQTKTVLYINYTLVCSFLLIIPLNLI